MVILIIVAVLEWSHIVRESLV